MTKLHHYPIIDNLTNLKAQFERLRMQLQEVPVAERSGIEKQMVAFFRQFAGRANVARFHPPWTVDPSTLFGPMRDYVLIDLSSLGSISLVINNADQIIGETEPISGRSQAFVWSAGTGQLSLLGTLGGSFSTSVAINEAGQVTGCSEIASGYFAHAFLWNAETGIQDLGTLEDNQSMSYYPVAMNEAPQIIGFSEPASGYYANIFLWSAETGMQGLSTLGGSYSRVRAINNAGQVVGSSDTADGHTRATLWSTDTGIIDLGSLGGTDSLGWAINDAGQVVGWSVTADGQAVRAFLWSAETGMKDLGALGGKQKWSWAEAINNAGQIVGWSETADGHTHATLWSADTGQMKDLGTNGGTHSAAVAINEVGQVVGYVGDDFYRHAFLWSADKGMQDLNSMPFSSSTKILYTAEDINERGNIVLRGSGDDPFLLWKNL